MRFYTFLVLFCLSLTTQAQWIHKDLLTSPSLDKELSDHFFFEAEAIGFFKNNEYFSPVAKGQTLPGMRFIPKIGYQIEDKFRFEIGSSGSYYSGDQQSFGKRLFRDVHVRMQYAIEPNFNIILGNYHGGVNHQLIEPLYTWEKFLIDRPESGIQMIYKSQKYFADIWVNWQRFIERNDPLQEVLTFGVSSSINIAKKNSDFEIIIPLQLIINHKGGQIDTSEDRNVVLGNMATGIKTKYNLNRGFLKGVGMDFYAVGYYDKLSNNDLRPYDSGLGFYPVVTLDATPFNMMVGYWHAKHYYSIEGEPLFRSFSEYHPGEILPTRKILTTKLSYTKKLHEMISVGAQAELYTDLNRKDTDYSFGVHARFNLAGLKWKW